jgi:hypothetical protein
MSTPAGRYGPYRSGFFTVVALLCFVAAFVAAVDWTDWNFNAFLSAGLVSFVAAHIP